MEADLQPDSSGQNRVETSSDLSRPQSVLTQLKSDFQFLSTKERSALHP